MLACTSTSRGKCTILANKTEDENEIEIICCGSRPTCKFRKSRLTIRRELEKVYRRLRTLPEDLQDQISAKYYNEKYPWKEILK
jgi:hypothetical protein